MNSAEQDPIAWVRNNQDKLVKFIQELVRIPSVIGSEEEIQNFIYKKLTELDLKPKFIYPDIETLQKSDLKPHSESGTLIEKRIFHNY